MRRETWVNRIAPNAAAILIPVGIFLYFFHWQILIPTNVTWLLRGDWGAHVIGWNAFRHDDWRWPLGVTQLLAWPSGVPVTYTDSNPLMCLLLKPFSAVLPEPFQFTGLWLFSCILLQFWAAYALLVSAAQDRWLRLLGAALLTVVPTLINRMGHADLCAHWTILLALHAFLNVERPVRRDLLYGAILAVSALVHPYLLIMNASIWGSDVLHRAWALLRSRDAPGFGALAARSAAVAAAPVAALWAVGGLGGYQGDAGGFGYYSMALDALFNPGTAGYSRFFPVKPQGPGQIFEGFQYLGAGLIAMVAAALATLATHAGRERLWRMSWLAWLAPALFVLLALALSDHVLFHGRVVARISYDWIPFHLTSTFRSSGRLFWPCAYVLILVALKLVFSLPRAWPFAIGLAALALQFADLPGFTSAARAQTEAAPAGNQFVRTPSPKWEALIASADVVEFQPPDPHVDEGAFDEIAWRASSMKRPVNVMYTARLKPEQRTFETASRSAFLLGQLNPKRLYIVTDGCIPAGFDMSRLKQVNRIVVIPPKDAHYPFVMRAAPAPDPFPIGRTVSLAPETPQFRCVLGRDWSGLEDWGVWSAGPDPELLFRLAARPSQDLLLTIAAQPFPEEGQGVSVIVGGRAVGRLMMAGGAAEYTVRVPLELIPGPTMDVTLKVDHPQSPSTRGDSTDTRLLGIGLRSVRLDPAAPIRRTP